MNNTNGNIAEQSKKKIAEAMLKVMNTYDYKEITVTQITQEARISRKTFYRHFRDKDEVLKHLFEESYDRSFEVFRSVRTADIADHYGDQLPYLLAYSIGGMNSMLIKWIEDGMSIPSSTLILHLREGFNSEM